MSDSRYFMDPDDGDIFPSRDGNVPGAYDTEVQVVPLDAITIRRDELPEVEELPNSLVRVDGASFDPIGCDGKSLGADHFDRSARRYLAIAAYLREHPPVDEEQVKALADHVAEIVGFRDQPGAYHVEIARRLVERGVRVATSDG